MMNKISKKRIVLSIILFALSGLILIAELAFALYVRPMGAYEYIYEWIEYAVIAIIIALAGAGLLVIFIKKRKAMISIIAAAVLLIAADAAVAATIGSKTETYVSQINFHKKKNLANGFITPFASYIVGDPYGN